MSEVSPPRRNREQIKQLRKQRKKAAQALREKQQAQGLKVPIKAAIPNRKSEYGSVQEEQKARQEVAQDSAEIVTMQSRHAWISSKPLDKFNVHKRCNLGARHRWCIESGFLVEKRHGYQYEHMFAYNWNAMKGYHYLMRLGHLINVLSHNCECLYENPFLDHSCFSVAIYLTVSSLNYIHSLIEIS